MRDVAATIHGYPKAKFLWMIYSQDIEPHILLIEYFPMIEPKLLLGHSWVVEGIEE